MRQFKQFICETCGSDDVSQDAVARWDVVAQAWVISSLLDNCDCENCGGETNLREVPVSRLELEILKQQAAEGMPP